jgi:hypothetical protein
MEISMTKQTSPTKQHSLQHAADSFEGVYDIETDGAGTVAFSTKTPLKNPERYVSFYDEAFDFYSGYSSWVFDALLRSRLGLTKPDADQPPLNLRPTRRSEALVAVMANPRHHTTSLPKISFQPPV